MTQITNYDASGAVINEESYVFDADGQVTSKTTLDGSWAYAYDDAGQLTQATFQSTNAALEDLDLRYAYDAAGNRTSTSKNGVCYDIHH